MENFLDIDSNTKADEFYKKLLKSKKNGENIVFAGLSIQYQFQIIDFFKKYRFPVSDEDIKNLLCDVNAYGENIIIHSIINTHSFSIMDILKHYNFSNIEISYMLTQIDRQKRNILMLGLITVNNVDVFDILEKYLAKKTYISMLTSRTDYCNLIKPSIRATKDLYRFKVLEKYNIDPEIIKNMMLDSVYLLQEAIVFTPNLDIFDVCKKYQIPKERMIQMIMQLDEHSENILSHSIDRHKNLDIFDKVTHFLTTEQLQALLLSQKRFSTGEPMGGNIIYTALRALKNLSIIKKLQEYHIKDCIITDLLQEPDFFGKNLVFSYLYEMGQSSETINFQEFAFGVQQAYNENGVTKYRLLQNQDIAKMLLEEVPGHTMNRNIVQAYDKWVEYKTIENKNSFEKFLKTYLTNQQYDNLYKK